MYEFGVFVFNCYMFLFFLWILFEMKCGVFVMGGNLWVDVYLGV